jgi:hypothetical protein
MKVVISDISRVQLFKKVKNAFYIFLLEKVAQSTISRDLVRQEEMDGLKYLI